MNRLFPDSIIDINTQVPSVISESRASVNSGIFKNRTKNLVKATECVLWSNRGDVVPKVNIPVESIGKVSEMISSEATKKKTTRKKKIPTSTSVSANSTEEESNNNLLNIQLENNLTNEVQNTILPAFVPCSCHPADLCLMKTTDASTSMHKCFKCCAKIFAICAPQFEDTLEVLCRNCVSSKKNDDIVSKKKLPGKSKRKRRNKDDNTSSDEDVFIHRAQSSSMVARRGTNSRKAISRLAAISSNTKNADIFSGTRDYHDDPELLFQSEVHRY